MWYNVNEKSAEEDIDIAISKWTHSPVKVSYQFVKNLF